MKVKVLIETNNQLREQLTKENQSYYDKLLVYTRLKGGMIYSEQQSEEILLVILEDILEAQNEGISAETYFGKEPQKVADSMLRELKPEPWQTKVKFGGYLIGIYALFTLFPSLVSPRQGIDLGKFLLSFSVVVVMVSLLFKLVKASIYQEIKWEKTKIFMLLFIGLSLSILGGIFLPDILVVRLEGGVGIVVIVLLMFAATYYCLQKTNEMYRPFLAIVYLNGLVGLMSRLPFSSNYLQLIDDQVLVIITVLTSTGLFYFLSYRQFKQLKIAGNS